jgi:GxxExxY protein
MTGNAIAKEIMDAAFHIHTVVGPGLLESVYQAVLAYELSQRGLSTVSQQPIPVVYGNHSHRHRISGRLGRRRSGDRGIKSVEVVAPVHKKQPF